MANKTLSQIFDEIFDETIGQETNAFIIMFNALLSVETQIIQNQMTIMGCLTEFITDDEEYLGFLDRTIDKNEELVKSMLEVIHQSNETD